MFYSYSAMDVGSGSVTNKPHLEAPDEFSVRIKFDNLELIVTYACQDYRSILAHGRLLHETVIIALKFILSIIGVCGP